MKPALFFVFILLGLFTAVGNARAAAPVNPVGDWQHDNAAGTTYSFRRFDILANGTFVETEGAHPASGPELTNDTYSGSWSVSAPDNARSLWDQLKVRFGLESAPGQDITILTLRYSVPARSELPVGATVVKKQLEVTQTGQGSATQALVNAARTGAPAPAGGLRQTWTINESHYIVLETDKGNGKTYLYVDDQRYAPVK